MPADEMNMPLNISFPVEKQGALASSTTFDISNFGVGGVARGWPAFLRTRVQFECHVIF